MTFGEKLRKARQLRSMTQAELAGDRMTRNMLSQLENDKAQPSLAALHYLSEKLRIPAGFFIDDIDEFGAKKLAGIHAIRNALGKRDYVGCKKLCLELGSEKECTSDDEISRIMVECNFNIGYIGYREGDFTAACEAFGEMRLYCGHTVYDTSVYLASAALMERVMAEVTGNGAKDAGKENCRMISGYLNTALMWSDDCLNDESRERWLEAVSRKDNGEPEKAAEYFADLLEITDSIPEKYRIMTMIEECAAKSGDYERAYACSRRRLELLGKIK